MGDARRPFDIKPTIFIAIFSAALAGALIAVNTLAPSDTVETAALRVLDEGAERVGARQIGQQSASRQVVSPVVSPASVRLLDGGRNDLAFGVAGSDFAEARVAGGGDANLDGDSSTNTPTPDPGQDTQSAPSPPTTTARSGPSQESAPAPATTNGRAVTTTTTTTSDTTTTSSRAAVTPTTVQATTTRPPTTTTRPPATGGRWTVAQVIDGTISAGDGSNPIEEAPMGRHDAPLYLPQNWNWAQGPARNAAWGNLRSGQYAEWRCAVIPENGHNPPVPFRVNVRSGAYFQYVNGNWNKAFDASLTSTNNGAYLAQAGVLNADPFSSGSHGQIQWRREADGSYSAPWNSSALMMHFWAGKRQAPAAGQTAEFLTSEMRIQQPDGQTVDLSRVKVLFQCGIDYYNTTGGQGTKVPGPGIAKYHRLTTAWKPGLWVTLPGNVPANSVADFRNWLEAHLPPDVRR